MHGVLRLNRILVYRNKVMNDSQIIRTLLFRGELAANSLIADRSSYYLSRFHFRKDLCDKDSLFRSVSLDRLIHRLYIRSEINRIMNQVSRANIAYDLNKTILSSV